MLLKKPNNVCSNYSLTKPVHKDGTFTQYATLLLYVYNNHQSTKFSKVSLLENALGWDFSGNRYSGGHGWCTNQMAMLNLNNLITYDRSARKLKAGYNLNEYVETNILPFIVGA